MMLVTVVLVMTAMLAVTMAPALAIPGPPARAISSGGGVPVDPTVCTVLADDSGLFAWRPGGVCWFTPPAL
jgi:hypothetical protein